MSKTLLWTCCVLVLPLSAQETNSADRTATATVKPGTSVEPERRWYNFPIPLVGTSSLPPGPFRPLTPRGKIMYAVDRTIGPKALVNRGLLAGLNQWRNHPEEWGQGWEAYGKRFGYRMARVASRNAIMLASDLAMHTDQRYERCSCTGFFPRSMHAWKRVFVARTDSGGETVNIGRIAGAYGGLAVAYQVLPDRYQTAGRVLNHGSQYLALRMLGNTIREFWPEIHRAIRIGPRSSKGDY